MNRVLEKVFPSFNKNGSRPKTYYSYPEGSPSASVTFRVEYTGTETLSEGRLVLFFAPKSDPEPRFEAFELDTLKPIFAQEVLQVVPGGTIDFDSAMFSMPEAMAFVPNDLSAFTDELYVQALFSENLDDPDANSCLGNHYSKPVRVTLEHLDGERIVNIVADQVITETMDLTSDEWVQHVAMKSELLSEYHGKDVFMFASVVLPLNYASRAQDATFPTIYYIEGFTGTETFADRARAFLSSEMGDVWKSDDWEVPMFRVTLGSRFKFGHTSFADSESNGPWGTALVSEFIPYLESHFPMVKDSTGRFLHGHSSGGWSALWLQIQHPEFFGGAWSSAPDPVDFSAFQIVNIYEAKNMFWDPYGRPYPTSRSDGDVTCTIRNENLVERVFANGNGGQWDAFFAVFGPRDYNTGLPVPLFDKSTGLINRDVVEYWSRFDIVKVLREGGEALLDRLQDKIHVVCGSEDTYYLEGACYKLQEIFGAKSKPHNAYQPVFESYVDIVPGDHTTIRNRGYYQVVFEEIMIAYMRNQED